MECTRCAGKVKVLDNVQNHDDREIYRKKVCVNCGHTFFTVEFEVDSENETFKRAWDAWHRRGWGSNH